MVEALAKSRDCDALDQSSQLVPVRLALEIARGLVRPITEFEPIDIRNAVGRVTAIDLCAPRPMPFFSNSAMDGFAVRTSQLTGNGPQCLRLLGTITAGSVNQIIDERPGAYRIFTGAPVPHGFDAVIMQEHCLSDGRTVTLRTRPAVGGNIRFRGEDIAEGDIIVRAGTLLEARHIGLLAANGIYSVPLVRRLRIGIFSTGDELVRGDVLTRASSIFDANGPMLHALCAGPMFEVTDLGILPDEMAALVEFLRSLDGRFDLIISSGAASTGERDMLREALIISGGTIDAYRVALKPGKPIFFGKLGAALFTGLPGNPLSAYVGFQLFVATQIAALTGRQFTVAFSGSAICAINLRRKAGRTEYLPARIVGIKDQLPVVEPVGHGSSATLFPLNFADGMCVIPAECDGFEEGNILQWVPFHSAPTLSEVN
jgi:molybdopterin molybdotransferase